LRFKVYIPARYDSERLPGKPLLDIAGRPLIQHVHDQALCSGAEEIVIATDDQRVADVAEGFGATVVMTASTLASGTDRIAAASAERNEPYDLVIVNVQGDEPEIPAPVIDQVAALLEPADREMATLYEPIADSAEVFDPNVVKVVTDGRDRALYFSRAPIPWDRGNFNQADHRSPVALGAPYYRHLGIYAYRVGFLRRLGAWSQTPLERLERLEQLRALEHGAAIYTAKAVHPTGIGVDTEADLERVRQRATASGKTGRSEP
jgi:3-deoxy-manno-octulosonate cytidylyltransferase (CMP-KDO synthetase)